MFKNCPSYNEEQMQVIILSLKYYKHYLFKRQSKISKSLIKGIRVVIIKCWIYTDFDWLLIREYNFIYCLLPLDFFIPDLVTLVSWDRVLFYKWEYVFITNTNARLIYETVCCGVSFIKTEKTHYWLKGEFAYYK